MAQVKKELKSCVKKLLSEYTFHHDDERWEGVRALTGILASRTKTSERSSQFSEAGLAAGLFLTAWRLAGSPSPYISIKDVASFIHVSRRTVSARQQDARNLLTKNEYYRLRRGESELMIPDGSHCHLCGAALEEACVRCLDGGQIYTGDRTCRTCDPCPDYGDATDLEDGTLGCPLTLGDVSEGTDLESGPWYAIVTYGDNPGHGVYETLAEARLARGYFVGQPCVDESVVRIHEYQTLREALRGDIGDEGPNVVIVTY